MGTSFWQVNAFSNYFVIVRAAGYQRFLVNKRYRRKIFVQIATVAYLKKQPQDVFHRKRCS